MKEFITKDGKIHARAIRASLGRRKTNFKGTKKRGADAKKRRKFQASQIRSRVRDKLTVLAGSYRRSGLGAPVEPPEESHMVAYQGGDKL